MEWLLVLGIVCLWIWLWILCRPLIAIGLLMLRRVLLRGLWRVLWTLLRIWSISLVWIPRSVWSSHKPYGYVEVSLVSGLSQKIFCLGLSIQAEGRLGEEDRILSSF